jgi:hypothetical protein
MRACAKILHFSGIFDSGPTVHVKQFDMRIQQAGNGYFKTEQFGSLFVLPILIKKWMGGSVPGGIYCQC